MAAANSIDENTSGITNFTGTAFNGTTTTQYNVVIGGAAVYTIASVAPSATLGIPLVSQGAAVNPAFSTAVVAGGGTGVVTQTAYSLVCGGTTTTGAFQGVGPDASTHSLLYATGTGSLPAFSTTGTPYVTGISFDSGTNVLQAFAEGTWNPAIGATGSAPAVGYTSQVGRYSRVGNGVDISANIVLSSYTAGTGDVTVTDYPFTSAAVTNQSTAGFLDIQSTTFSASALWMTTELPSSTTTATVAQSKSAAAAVNLPSNGALGATSQLLITQWYSLA